MSSHRQRWQLTETGRALLRTQHPRVPHNRDKWSWHWSDGHTQGRDPKGLPWGYLLLWFSGCPSGTHRQSTGPEELASEVNGGKVNGTGASASMNTNKCYSEGLRALKCALGFIWFLFCCLWKSSWNHSTWESLDCFTKVWLEEQLSGNTTASQLPRNKMSCP